jgi:hypothetical protein
MARERGRASWHVLIEDHGICFGKNYIHTEIERPSPNASLYSALRASRQATRVCFAIGPAQASCLRARHNVARPCLGVCRVLLTPGSRYVGQPKRCSIRLPPIQSGRRFLAEAAGESDLRNMGLFEIERASLCPENRKCTLSAVAAAPLSAAAASAFL